LYPDSVPELPEVETIVRGLHKRVAGDTIESVWIGSKKQPMKSSAGVIATTLEGKRIGQVHRAGKHIVFDLEQASQAAIPTAIPTKKGKRGGRSEPRQAASLQASDAQTQWIVHLGMTGSIVVCEPAAEIVKHTHLIAKLASGRELRFIDPRMFGKLSVHTGGFDPGGVEPLEVSEEEFVALFRGRKTPIKSALLNQKLLRGVGNIYADESLFRAGIRPRRRASVIVRRLPSADLRFPIMWMPMGKKDSSSSSIGFMAARESAAWCAETSFGALCSPAAAAITAKIVKNSPNRTI
jgi:formamidopyrimidine-DNA glycosylase